MLIDASVTIAYKCTSCGSFEFFSFSLFILPDIKDSGFSCRCKKSCIVLKQEGENNLLISIPCITCGSEHTYLLTKRNILSAEPLVLNCPETGMKICFIGKDDAVRKNVDSLEKEFDKLMDMYGYECYFTNTQVMFDMVNRIHDIALRGNLCCECGSKDIDMVMLSDCILLRCGKCGGNKKIAAARNKDLKEIIIKNQILLTCEDARYYSKNDKHLLSRQSGDKFGK